MEYTNNITSNDRKLSPYKTTRNISKLLERVEDNVKDK